MGLDLGQTMKYVKFAFICPFTQMPVGYPPLTITFDTTSNRQISKLQALLTPSS